MKTEKLKLGLSVKFSKSGLGLWNPYQIWQTSFVTFCCAIVKYKKYLPDGNNVAHVKRIVIHLGDEDGGDGLIERCAIHVNSCTNWEDKSSNSLIDAIVLLSTSERDRQRGRAGNQDGS